MLSDRPYLRDDDPRVRTSVLTWLLCATAAVFVLQFVLVSPAMGGGPPLDRWLALTIPGLRAGWLWTLCTHGFLHDTGFLFHLLGNLLGLYFIGRELLPMLGARRFLSLYFGAIVAGGLAWTLVHWRLGGVHDGATAGVAALLIVFAGFYPNRRMDFLLFFIFPVSVKPKHLALGVAGLGLVGLVFYEMPGATLPFNYGFAHSAHLGGMATGWIYFRFLHEARWNFSARRSDLELPRWMKRPAPAAPPVVPSPVNLRNRTNLRAEVDRILDKINSQGFGALTADEKRVLDEAKDLLSRP
ncbi:MAG: rhomboid family intramembrane serine protease [Opitutaceae bacterium]|nr:rhomboid family intramembrane serine protease [Opitutaceae bacterium]